ncbi:hypothetical protein CKO25_08775 [Thiocapsa imhoffii]|uniref:PDZ domain-containing protein n=1 Tax=Thiocapsa imhoffii TaxID=382777 RepID=A0A9X0WI65_9GAMM|nr:PDZ domain-containing protein [Thiocapsa imhoffii]MBK1644739.1 hypothetical protein [Thiocapsa imhoffii]
MRSTQSLSLAGFIGGVLIGAASMAGFQAMTDSDLTPPESGPPAAPDAAEPIANAALAVISPPPDPLSVGAPPPSARAETSETSMRQLERQVQDLRIRLVSLEQSMAQMIATTARQTHSAEARRPDPPRTTSARRAALVAAGVEHAVAERIVLRDAQRSLDQLALRDQATREGWFGTEEYREQLTRLNADARPLREEIGDDTYDLYLFTTGADNRVAVDSVIPGSAAEFAGLQPGDLIEAYADERLFDFSELRRKTTEGEAGELVAVRLRRDGAVIDTWIPRGPLGVTLDSARFLPRP